MDDGPGLVVHRTGEVEIAVDITAVGLGTWAVWRVGSTEQWESELPLQSDKEDSVGDRSPETWDGTKGEGGGGEDGPQLGHDNLGVIRAIAKEA